MNDIDILKELKTTLEEECSRQKFDFNNNDYGESYIMDVIDSSHVFDSVEYDEENDVYNTIFGVDECQLLCLLPYKYDIKVGDTIKVRFGDSNDIWECTYTHKPSYENNEINAFRCELKAPFKVESMLIDIYVKENE